MSFPILVFSFCQLVVMHFIYASGSLCYSTHWQVSTCGQVCPLSGYTRSSLCSCRSSTSQCAHSATRLRSTTDLSCSKTLAASIGSSIGARSSSASTLIDCFSVATATYWCWQQCITSSCRAYFGSWLIIRVGTSVDCWHSAGLSLLLTCLDVFICKNQLFRWAL